ncbi:hypothetical protein [Spiroplasma endosymbiont of Polydrusus pterygomalis]|uniref:hypothetical protein n=1 Tax=Spiroplasma endosymbiont of Polydrusus pterygomalis TaxID=3139327 RepID=UPI003CCA8884
MGNGIRLYNDDIDVNLNRNFQKEKELILYYNDTDKKHDFTYTHDWYYNHTGNKIIKTFNLGRNNPIEYNKIEFLGNDENFKLSRVSWGNVPYYSEKKINDFNNKSLHEVIKNYKFNETNKDKISDYTTILLQPKTTKWWNNAWLEWSQSLGLTWYWENNNYFLQVISNGYANDGGSLFMGIGNGIRLYNDELEKNNHVPNLAKFAYSTINTTIPNLDINTINSINYQNQSLANFSSTNIPTI